MAEPDPKDAFGFVNGTLHTTPELTEEEEDGAEPSVESGRRQVA
jgi:hypothetical protein